MNIDTELNKITDYISNLSGKELDKILFDCGIESIRPSIDSDYVVCLKKIKYLSEKDASSGYRKALWVHNNIKEEYFYTKIMKQEVA